MRARSTAVRSFVARGPRSWLHTSRQADCERSPRVGIGKEDTDRRPAACRGAGRVGQVFELGVELARVEPHGVVPWAVGGRARDGRAQRVTVHRATVLRGNDKETLPQHRRQPQRLGQRRQAVLEGGAGLSRGENLVEVVVGALEEKEHDEAAECRILQAVESPDLGEPSRPVGVQVRQPDRTGQLLRRPAGGRRQQAGEQRAVPRLQVAAELRPHQHVDRSPSEVLELTGREAHDPPVVQQQQDAGDRRQQVLVDAEDGRAPTRSTRSHAQSIRRVDTSSDRTRTRSDRRSRWTGDPSAT